MAYADQREFLVALDKWGELVTIEEEADWNLEVGAVARRICEIGAPAALFKKIKGYPPGFGLLASPIARGRRNTFSRVAIALELDPDTPYYELLDVFMKRTSNPIKPIQVSTGPCKQNIMKGKDVNLFKLPAPYLHDGDGGRYIGTWDVTITKDPDSGWVNWGVYRQMLHTKNRMGGLVHPFNHLGMMFYQKYEPRNEPMPYALAFGCDPSVPIVGSVSFPAGVNEADVAGGIRRAPVSLVKCETNDLLVPATSEVVVEGVLIPHLRWDEGPFGEYTGYRASPRMPRPVYRVDCITFRNDPVIPMSCMGVPIDECDFFLTAFGHVSEISLALKAAGIEGVRSVYSPPELIGHLLVVSVKKDRPGLANEIEAVVRTTKSASIRPYVMVCEDDVDITSLDEIFHALATKCHPARGYQVIKNAPGSPLMPFLDLHDRQFAKSSNGTFDCTWPVEWDPVRNVPSKVSFATAYPKEIKERALEKWQAIFGTA